MIEFIALALGFMLIVMMLLYRKALSELRAVSFSKQSLSSKYGRMSEQFMPFMKDYPYDPQNFRFLGTPIDGIQFEPDRLVFIEFKTGDSRLTAKQRDIRELVKEKKIEFREIRISPE